MVFPLKRSFTENIFYLSGNWVFTAVEKKFSMRTTCVLEPEDSEKEILGVQTTIVLKRSYSNLVQKKLVLTNWCFFWDLINFKVHFLVLFSNSRTSSVSTVCGRCRFLDCKKQDLKVAQSVKNDSATGPLQKTSL